jgi:two-component system, NtrC family, nitrogen regulation sensor histidine kinase NtrY
VTAPAGDLSSRPGAWLTDLLLLGVVLACAADVWSDLRHHVVPALAAIVLAAAFRRGRRLLVGLALAAVAVTGAARLHARLITAAGPEQVASRKLERAVGRAGALSRELTSAARRAAQLAEAAPALAGSRPELSRLFARLEAQRLALPDRAALAIHGATLSPVAWAGRALELHALRGLTGDGERLFVLAGSVSTSAIATAPVKDPGGRLVGFAAAELPIAAERHIRNQYLEDFDLLEDGLGGVEVSYVDARDDEPRPLPPLPAGAREAEWKAADGQVLGVLRAVPGDPEQIRRQLVDRYRQSVAGMACLAILAWMARPFSRTPSMWIAAGATVLRLVLALLGPPFPGSASPLLSPDIYASAPFGLHAALPSALFKSPIDLLLTVLWALALSFLAFLARSASPPARGGAWRTVAVTVPAVALVTLVLLFIGDTVANSSLDLEAIPLLPRSVPHLLLHLSMLLALAAGALLLVALFDLAGPFPASRRGRLARGALWIAVGILAYVVWPRRVIGLPLVPAVALFLIPALVAGTRPTWSARLKGASPGLLAGISLAAVAFLAAVLYPSLVHFGEKTTRVQIERDYARLVRRQPEWREYVLGQARRRIDAMEVLEESPAGAHPPGLEELAFAVWSETDLAAFGFSSAVEIQDSTGAVISRFALNLSSLSGPDRPLPATTEWEVSRERVTLASAQRRVLHARKRLVYHGDVHGAVHVYVGDDFWNLPFIVGTDPYSVLYRTSPRGSARDRALVLLVYDRDRDVVFSSTDRPPALPPDVVRRVSDQPSGIWTTLPVGGRAHHIFLFGDGQQLYGLAYPQAGPGHYAAALVEAASGLLLVALSVLLIAVLVRTALGGGPLSIPFVVRQVRAHFALRLFVAFIALAFVPVAVLQVVVRAFVAERLRRGTENQALELGTVAKKAVDDFVFFQRGEARGAQPVTDAALVWVSSLIRNDLDVFERGRLVASSKRELYASGLLAPRVSGSVYRALVLEGEPSVVRTEQIGGFSYLVVSLPVQLGGPEPGILSVPLALRQREVDAALLDLDRTVRLASVVFLVVAAALAQSVARRISGPIRDLTRATRRVAGGDLGARVAATSQDELKDLVESFNQMAGDLERQRRDLERSNRLAAWAEMARQVAHEVKNPLTPIQLSAEHLRRVFHEREQDFAATLETCTQTILKQVRILRGIVTEFSAFARPPAPTLEPLELDAVLQEVLRPYQAALPPGVELLLETGEDVPRVMADRRLLSRAVVNLVENALQAVGDHGRIGVRLRRARGGVEVEVEDTGPGIEPELQERLFDPFFSTKSSGSGLGLALVKRIAEDHGGAVSLRSAAGEKTRAVLWLPVPEATTRKVAAL